MTPEQERLTAWAVVVMCTAIAVLFMLSSCAPPHPVTWPARDSAGHRLTCHMEANGAACRVDSANATH